MVETFSLHLHMPLQPLDDVIDLPVIVIDVEAESDDFLLGVSEWYSIGV